MSGPASSPPARHLTWDATRALASLLVVALHASVAYMITPPRGLMWPADTPAPHGIFDAVFAFARPLGTPLFTVLAGYFAAQAIARVGPVAFLKRRAWRLVLPLCISGPVILFAMLNVWRWGWCRAGLIPSPWSPLPAEMLAELDGPAHLWYLEYLIILAAGHCLVAALSPKAAEPLVARLAHPLLRWLLIGGGIAACVVWWPGIMIGFDNGYTPRLPLLTYHALFYLVGVATRLARTHRPGAPLAAPWIETPALLVASVGLIMTTGAINRGEPVAPWQLPLCTAACCMGIVGTLFSLQRIPRHSPPWLSRLADAGFTTYLLHPLLQGTIVVLLVPTPLPPELKFLIVLAGSVAGCLTIHAAACQSRWGVLLGASHAA